MTSVQSVKTAQGVLKVGDLVFMGCDDQKVASRIMKITLPDGAINSLKDCPGTSTYNGEICTLENGRKAHPSCLRKS